MANGKWLDEDLSRESSVPLASLIESVAYYKDKEPAPDFGAYYGVKPVKIISDVYVGIMYSYLLSELEGEADDIIDGYAHLLWQNLFTLIGYTTHDGEKFDAYRNPGRNVTVEIGAQKVDGEDCITVFVT